jgi:hypothetical protein
MQKQKPDRTGIHIGGMYGCVGMIIAAIIGAIATYSTGLLQLPKQHETPPQPSTSNLSSGGNSNRATIGTASSPTPLASAIDKPIAEKPESNQVTRLNVVRNELDTVFMLNTIERSGDNIVLNFTVSTKDSDKEVELWDDEAGTQLYYSEMKNGVDRYIFGSSDTTAAARQRLPMNVPINLKVIFYNVPMNVHEFNLLELRGKLSNKPLNLKFPNLKL